MPNFSFHVVTLAVATPCILRSNMAKEVLWKHCDRDLKNKLQFNYSILITLFYIAGRQADASIQIINKLLITIIFKIIKLNLETTIVFILYTLIRHWPMNFFLSCPRILLKLMSVECCRRSRDGNCYMSSAQVVDLLSNQNQ